MWTEKSEFHNPHYRLPTDTPETLDYKFLVGVTGLLVHAVLSSRRGWVPGLESPEPRSPKEEGCGKLASWSAPARIVILVLGI
jgi:hypothetical protein